MTVERPLEGRRVLVVGGASGIGFAAAGLLARDGATVTIAGRTEATLREAAERLGGAVGIAVCDATRGGDVDRAVGIACGGGPLDGAVCVPGGGSFRGVLDFGDDQFGTEVLLNVMPQYLVLKHAARAMGPERGGSIVAVSSTAGRFATPFLASYAAGKAAVDHLVRVAAAELGPRRVRVNAVAPGLTRTASTAGLFADGAVIDRFLAEIPLGRTGEPADVAAAIRYLLGPESSWVTGAVLAVDGGQTLNRFPSPGSATAAADPLPGGSSDR